MKKILIILFMFSFFNKVYATSNERAYDFKFIGIDGNIIKLSSYENKIIVVVNVASRCGYTPQYEDLQSLWSKYKKKGLVVIGVPTNNFSFVNHFLEKNNSKKYPNNVESKEPVSTPIFTPSMYSKLLAKARFPTNKLIVKPIPVNIETA